jgi:predicted alpha/beta superfamily hydrolase
MTQPAHPRFGLFNTEERTIHADGLGQGLRIGVWFPFSYGSSGRTYPVLYVPDGEFAYGLATGLMPVLVGTEGVPEMLVVGIAYHGIAGWQDHAVLRERDLLPPGFQKPPDESRVELFTDFLRQVLFPLVEAEYHGAADDRALFGFSSGGFFAVHTMLTRPGMFRRYIAASCTWPKADDYLLGCERTYAQRSVDPPADLGQQDVPGVALRVPLAWGETQGSLAGYEGQDLVRRPSHVVPHPCRRSTYVA